MQKFAFVIHPLEIRRDAARKYPILGFFPTPVVEQIALRISPKLISHITGIRSQTGIEAEGWFVGCPLSPRQLLQLPPEMVYDRLVDAGKFSADLGAKIMGLGAYTSVAGDAGVTVARRLEGIISVTSGNSYTVYTALQGLLRGAEMMEIDPATAKVAIIGATGAIGAVGAKMLSESVAELSLVGRNIEKLEHLAAEIRLLPARRAEIRVTSHVKDALREADLILAVSAAGKELIFPDDLKPGTVVCDVARPRDVSKSVAERRDDVLVIDGGVIEVPGSVKFNFSFGFPERTAYACMSETILMALEDTYESYTLGREISVEQVRRIGEIAQKHGFKLAGFRSFERAVTPEEVARVLSNARNNTRRKKTVLAT